MSKLKFNTKLYSLLIIGIFFSSVMNSMELANSNDDPKTNIIELTNDNIASFRAKKKLRTESAKPTIIYFYMDSCYTCEISMSPIFKKLSEEISDLVFAQLNIVKYPEIAEQFEVDGVPTFIVLENGIETIRHHGFDKVHAFTAHQVFAMWLCADIIYMPPKINSPTKKDLKHQIIDIIQSIIQDIKELRKLAAKDNHMLDIFKSYDIDCTEKHENRMKIVAFYLSTTIEKDNDITFEQLKDWIRSYLNLAAKIKMVKSLIKTNQISK